MACHNKGSQRPATPLRANAVASGKPGCKLFKNGPNSFSPESNRHKQRFFSREEKPKCRVRQSPLPPPFPHNIFCHYTTHPPLRFSVRAHVLLVISSPPPPPPPPPGIEVRNAVLPFSYPSFADFLRGGSLPLLSSSLQAAAKRYQGAEEGREPGTLLPPPQPFLSSPCHDSFRRRPPVSEFPHIAREAGDRFICQSFFCCSQHWGFNPFVIETFFPALSPVGGSRLLGFVHTFVQHSLECTKFSILTVAANQSIPVSDILRRGSFVQYLIFSIATYYSLSRFLKDKLRFFCTCYFDPLI